MPSRNTVKEFAPNSYYHLYNRGVEKRDIFLDDQDYAVFLGLLKKYLIGKVDKASSNQNRHRFDAIGGQLDLLAYCLMPNHFHLLLYQHDEQAITRFMRRVMTGYVMYFNDRYNRVGSLFQGRYKASHINADAYLHHISRYIHLNPTSYQTWPASSLPYYLGTKSSSWLKPEAVMALFNDDPEEYKRFLADYETTKDELAVLKWQLANEAEM